MNKIKLLYIGNKLSKHGNTPSTIETLGKQLEVLGFKVYYAGQIKNKVLRLLEMQIAILKNLRKTKYVLIDTYSTNAFWFAFCSGVLCRLCNKKYITILHGGDLPTRLKRNPKLCNILFNYSHLNVAVSNYLHTEFKKRGLNSIVIPNNIDIENYPFKERVEFNPKLLWVRSFQKEYNPDMMVYITEELIKDFPNIKVCMIGPDKDGSMDRVKSLITSKNLENSFEITGRLEKKEWIKKARNYDIFVNTTNFDNTPVSVIEAMALGLVVVSTNVGGLPYLLENKKDALLSNKEDVIGMVDNIELVLSNQLNVSKLINNARLKAESYNWEEVKEKWKTILK